MVKWTRERLIDSLKYLIFRLDTTKFILDKPHFDYQPIPWKGINEARLRGKASFLRWQEIRYHIDDNYISLKDLGCCVGYFPISASTEYAINSIGIDCNSKYLRIAEYATPTELIGNCNFINLKIDEDNVSILPETDITLCLSIWHHWVFEYGIEKASNILQNIWNKTNNVIFFESGEEEVKDEFDLPFDDSRPAKKWLTDYLQRTCNNSKVEIIGEFAAGEYPHYKIKNHKRSLFKVKRDD